MSFFFNNDNAPKTSYTPLELVSEMENRDDILLIDIREPHELAQNGIANSVYIPMGQMEAKLDSLPKDKDLIVCCHLGFRSKQMRRYLQKSGFYRAAHLKGGINRWHKEVSTK